MNNNIICTIIFYDLIMSQILSERKAVENVLNININIIPLPAINDSLKQFLKANICTIILCSNFRKIFDEI